MDDQACTDIATTSDIADDSLPFQNPSMGKVIQEAVNLVSREASNVKCTLSAKRNSSLSFKLTVGLGNERKRKVAEKTLSPKKRANRKQRKPKSTTVKKTRNSKNKKKKETKPRVKKLRNKIKISKNAPGSSKLRENLE